MKKLLPTAVLMLAIAVSSFAQVQPLTVVPDGGNRKASTSEQIGIVKIVINYSRPGVKGREGQIWNTPVAHYGFVDLGHGTSTAAPWRAGANENTTLSFSHPVKIEGKDLPAGNYGFFISLGEEESELIFSKVNNSWGSFYYDPAEDALRVKVKNQKLDKSIEWLKYDFTDQTDNSAVIALSWEKRLIPFKVEADVQALQLASFKSEFRTTRPYYDFIQAANYCLENNIELDQALAWMDRAISFRVMGEKNFRTLITKTMILIKLNRIDEAKKIADETVQLNNDMLDMHFFGRQLLSMKQIDLAAKFLEANYSRYPKESTTNVGMARLYSAQGNYKKALVHMKAALPKALPTGKANIEAMIKKLEGNKDIN